MIKAIFDEDQRKIASNHKGMSISDIRRLAAEVKRFKLQVIIIASRRRRRRAFVTGS